MVRPIEGCELATEWTALGDDTTNLTTSTVRVEGDASLEFDKADGSANTIFACCYKSLPHLDFRDRWWLHDHMAWAIYVSALTNVAYSFVRIGTSASHYNEYRFADTSHVAGRWTLCHSRIGDAYVTGNGADWKDIQYLAVGVAFDAAGDTLADIRADAIHLRHSEPAA